MLKLSDKGYMVTDAKIRAATQVNPEVASSYRPSRDGGIESAEPLFLRRRLTLSCFGNGCDVVGSPAYQGRHVSNVMRSNTGGPHVPRLDGKDGYKAKPKCYPKYMWKSEGRKVLFEVRDNITLAEGSLPALVKDSKQGRAS